MRAVLSCGEGADGRDLAQTRGNLSLPADGRGIAGANDIVEVVEGVMHGGPLHQFDIDRDGNLAADDITVLVDLLNGAEPFESYWYTALPPLP